jgi:hypothetical protein
MPSAITLHCLVIYCFILYYTLSIACPLCPKPCSLQDMCHVLITCSPTDWLGLCHAIMHAISELMTHASYTHYMQFQSLWSTCHITITCRSGVCRAYAMPSLSAVPKLMRHMSCPQQFLHTGSYLFVLLCITSYYIAL